MNRMQARLTLFFTKNVGLHTWEETGNLERELAIYEKLTKYIDKVNFVTYGDLCDRRYVGKLGKIHIIPIKWQRFPWLTVMQLLLKQWRQIINTNILKTNQLQGAEIPILLKKFFHKKLVVRCGWLCSTFTENTTDNKLIHARVMQMEQAAFAAADIIVVTAPHMRRQVIDRYNIHPAKVLVIPNYVETDKFQPSFFLRDLDRPTWKICYIGRLSPEKNILSLLRGIHLCRGRIEREIELELYGSGPQLDEIKMLSDELQLHVRLMGNVPNSQLPERLNGADLFVLPSFIEGHPKALMEAMSCGLPCIGTEVSGIKELIKHNVTGYLCTTDASSIADAITVLLSDKELRTTIGLNAHQFIVDNFSLQEVLRLELDMIENLCSSDLR